jgi:hypothetical protein
MELGIVDNRWEQPPDMQSIDQSVHVLRLHHFGIDFALARKYEPRTRLAAGTFSKVTGTEAD